MTAWAIQLRLTREDGQGADQLAGPVWPRPGTSLPLPKLGSEAEASAIEWEDGTWLLRNRCEDMCLYLNGQTLIPGAIMPVENGDILEVGLRRYVIEALCDTNSLPASTGSLEPWAPDMLQGPDEMLLPGANPFDIVPAWTDEAAILSSSAPASTADEDDEGDSSNEVLRKLNREYFRALRDPEANTLLPMPKDRVRSASVGHLADDHADLTLEEFTTGVLDIDTLIGRFGSTDAPLAPREEHEDVLWLFAPREEMHQIRRTPPQVTRHDHHVIGIDSAHLINDQTGPKSRA